MPRKGFLQIVFAFFIFLPAFSQNSWQGKVIDAKTKAPIPFASIKIIHSNTQRIANADGRFELPSNLFLVHDTVIFSCVGYLPKSVPVKTMSVSSIINLNPVIYQLSAVNIISKGNIDYPYRLFIELCKKYRKYKDVSHAKGYFSFLSQYKDFPLEIIEGYFNGDVSCSNGISQLRLKNGRIGLCLNNFYSLNTTDIFTHFAPFSSAGNLNIPSSAGNFNFYRLKRLYDVRIIRTSVENGVKKFIIQFLAKKDSATLFSGLAWINNTDKTIDKLEYTLKNDDFYYLKPAIKGDKTDSIELSLKFIFDNSDEEHPTISRASLDYSLLYFSLQSANTIKIMSEGNLIFYDYTNPFPGTFPGGLIEGQINDYQKISCLPYDSVFWSNPGITPQSEKQKQFIDFLRNHGVLVNFSKSLDSIAGSNYIRWNATSDVSFSDILNRTPKHELKLLSEGVVTSFKETGNEPYDIICKILFNPVVMADSLHLSSVTLLNKTDSYYFLKRSIKAKTFLNLTFDLYEMKRREILARCKQTGKDHKLTIGEFQDIYTKAMEQLKDTVRIFQSETQDGTSGKELLSWYYFLSIKTGIDRSTLIQQMLDEK